MLMHFLGAVLKLLSEGLRGKTFIFDRGFREDSGVYLTWEFGMKMKKFYLKQLFNNFKTASYKGI